MPGAERKSSSYGRWYILGVICLMYLITYLDRVIISNTAPEVRTEFGFDQKTMGWIFSSFVLAYALFQVPGGWLSERFGPRRCFWGTDLTAGIDRFPKFTYQQRITHFTEELPFLSEQDKDWVMGRAIMRRLGWT